MTTDIDQTSLQDWMRNQPNIGMPVKMERVSGGQSNPTWFVTTPQRRMVLRKQPPGKLLRGAHAIDREYRILSALHPTDVPVPEPIAYCEDRSVIGTPFYLMERIDGRVFHDATLPGLPAEERTAIYLSMAEMMARMHAVDPADVGLADYGRPGGYFARQHRRWMGQWQQAESFDIPEIDALGNWLEARIPDDDGVVSIAHGDYRLGNLIYHPTEPKVVGILDWELSTLGHPLADLGFCCMTWHTDPDEYGGIRGTNFVATGIPTRQAFVLHYHAHAKPTPALTTFHQAFALFRFAVIFVGIADRSQRGNAAGHDAERLAPLARSFAQRGLELAQVGA